jgi:phosphatidylinositol alpha-1,6-mannosyltransferase
MTDLTVNRLMTDLGSVLFHNPRNGGGGHYIKQLELMSHLSKKDVDVTFVSPDGFESDDDIIHVPDRRIDFIILGYLTHLLSVLVTVLRRSPDRFVPFTLYGGFVGGIAAVLPTRTRTVLFVRGDLIRGMAQADSLKYTVLKPVTVAVEWLTFRLVDRIVFISDRNRQRMLRRTGLSEADVDSTVLYNDVYTDRVQEQLDREPVELDGWPVLGFAGGFPADEGKGLRYLIAAVGELAEMYPDVSLYLLGEGPNEEALRRYAAERGVADCVHFTGWVDNPLQYMQSFDLFVLPSLHEGLGNSLLEALAVGTPIVGSNVGGIPEVVGDDQYVFEPRSTSAIVETVETVFESEESYGVAVSHCRQRRDAFDFDWTEAATQLVAVPSGAAPDRVPPIDLPSTGPRRASGSGSDLETGV